jgi:TRAP-type C4-dicarboxylate transport system substrate-binding protein
MALKLGTIDGAMGGAGILEELKIKEVVKSYVASPIISPAFSSIMINLEAFKALPKDLQDLLQIQTPYITYALSSNWHNQCTWCLKNAQKEHGIKIENWSQEDVEKLTQLVAKEIYPKIADRGPGTAKLLDIVLKQMRDYGRIK